MLSAIVLEDEIAAQMRLNLLLKERNVSVLSSFTNAKEALTWIKNHEVDVIFVDIRLPEMNGLEFVEEVKKLHQDNSRIIFCTAYDDYAIEAFSLHVDDYLLKPIRAKRLEEALHRIPGYTENSDGIFRAFIFSTPHGLVKIHWQQVAYLQAEDKAVLLITEEGQTYALPKTLSYWAEQLGNKAIRIHRNALVMRHMLKSLVKVETDKGTRWKVEIKSLEELLPISRRQLRQVQDFFCKE
ncbi:MAG: DNA-binding response regulator [Haemophilus parainfluenzae]|jgi:two-component system regulatory protein|nr:MAG: DNA-binding response regulator [Haemophilus parainfluenzae]